MARKVQFVVTVNLEDESVDLEVGVARAFGGTIVWVHPDDGTHIYWPPTPVITEKDEPC